MSGAGDIIYGSTGPDVAKFVHIRATKVPLAEAAARLRQAVEVSGLWVLHEIDPPAILARSGYKIGAARQILFFHPDLMVRVLRADPAALLEAPLKFALMAMPDGTVSVRWLDPALSLARYGNAALAELGRELAALCEAIATNALEPPGA